MGYCLQGRRVTILGLGRSGRAAAELAAALGGTVFVSDQGRLDEKSQEWLEQRGFAYEEGEHSRRALEADVLVLSPGIRPGIPILEEARSLGIEVIGEIELAYRASRARLVAVTGTNGKSTTTSMIGHLLNSLGRRCLVGGNLAPGQPLCLLAKEAGPEDIIAAEVSSFQLESIVDFRPAVAVVTNLTPDHLDRHSDLEAYARAKARILENQREGDAAVLNADDQNLKKYFMPRAAVYYFSSRERPAQGAWSDGRRIFFSREGKDVEVMSCADLPLPGRHNLENALAAVAAAAALGGDLGAMGRALASFAGVPHRLELVARHDGVAYVNNSMCTNPAAGARSLEAVSGPVVVIAGGREKNLDMGPYLEAIAQRAKAVVLLGEARENMAAGLRRLGYHNIFLVRDLAEAVSQAKDLAAGQGTVLFSPGCSSFDMFRDFEERGEAFRQEVEKWRQR